MSKKGLIGAVKYTTILSLVILFFAMIILPGFAETPNAEGPFLNDSSIAVLTASDTEYLPSNTYGFEINVTNNTDPTVRVLPGWFDIDNCTFVTNLTSGTTTAHNITKDNTSLYTSFVNVTDTWYINFTTTQTKGAGDYTYYWSCNLTNNTWNQTLDIIYNIAQNTSITPQITNDSYVNTTFTNNWLWANVTSDLNSIAYNTSWCGVSINNTANQTLTNSSGNWNLNYTVLPDGYNNITYYCNSTSTNYSSISNASETYNFTVTATKPVLSGGTASGYLTSTTATIGVTTNENAVCRYSTTGNTAYADMETTTSSASGISHSWSVTASAYTTYNYYIRCNDTYGTITTTDYPINFTRSDTSSGGTSGSGGTTVEQTVEITIIDAGETKTMTFTDNDLGVTSVKIKAENDMNDVILKITKLESLPSDVDSTTGTVYKYLNFADTRMDDDDVDTATIAFRVTKTWLEFNEIDPDTIVMKRWNDGWERLTTNRVSDDNTYYEFEATTPGFSYFVIEGAVVSTDDSTSDTVETDAVEEDESTSMWPWVVVIVVILGVVGYYYYENFYKNKTPWKSLHKKWR